VICKICNLELKNLRLLSIHIKNHGVDSKEYYENYLKKNGDGICKQPDCKNKTELVYGLGGYSKFCSRKCQFIFMSTNCEINSKRKKSMTKRWKDKDSLLHSTERKEKIIKSLTGKKFTEERKKKQSVSHIGQEAWNKDKPGCFSEESRKKMSDSQKRSRQDPDSFWNSEEYEKQKENTRQIMLSGRAIKMLKCQKNPSKPELMLSEIVKKSYQNSEIQYPVLNYIVDIAIPEYRIAIEYDGYFHFNTEEHKEYHKIRQERIESEGWLFYRVTMFDKFPTLDQIKENIEKLINKIKK